MKTKHTPTPWIANHFQIQPEGNKFFKIADVSGFDLHEARANAELIVRVVNCHEELTEFLSNCVDIAHKKNGADFGTILKDMEELLKRARGGK